QGAAFLCQLQDRLTGLKEYLNVPPLSIQRNDLVFGQGSVRTQQHKIVLPVAAVTHENQFCGDRSGILISAANLYRHTQKIPGAAASVLTAAEDLFARARPALKPVMDLAAL